MDENNTPLPGDLADIDQLFRRLGLESPHLPYEVQQRFVDNEDMGIRERNRVEQHLKACTRCREEVRHLHRLHQQPEASWSLVAQGVKVPEIRLSFLQKLTQSSTSRYGLGLAVNAAALGFLWIGVGSKFTNQLSDARGQLKEVTARISTAQQQAESATIQAKSAEQKILTAEQRIKQEAAARAAAEKQIVTVRQETSQQLAAAQATAQKAEAEAARLRQAGPKPLEPREQAVRVALERGTGAAYDPLLDKGRGSRSSLVDPRTQGRPPAAEGTFGPVSPVRTAVITKTPVLRWNPYPGAKQYALLVTINGKSSTPIPVTGNEYQIQPKDLQRGEDYEWSVTPLDDKGDRIPGIAPSKAHFRVVGFAAARRYAQETLRLIQINLQNGLYANAEAQLKELIEAISDLPKESESAQNILDSLKH